MPQQRIDDALAQLVTAELIFRRGTPPDAEYTFKHALVQDAAYSTLLRSSRQQLHARIAATLESRFPEIAAAKPAVLAQHCAGFACVLTAFAERMDDLRELLSSRDLAENGECVVPGLLFGCLLQMQTATFSGRSILHDECFAAALEVTNAEALEVAVPQKHPIAAVRDRLRFVEMGLDNSLLGHLILPLVSAR
jgi:hypothetical protein